FGFCSKVQRIKPHKCTDDIYNAFHGIGEYSIGIDKFPCNDLSDKENDPKSCDQFLESYFIIAVLYFSVHSLIKKRISILRLFFILLVYTKLFSTRYSAI